MVRYIGKTGRSWYTQSELMIDKQVVGGPYRHRKNYLPFLCVGNVLGQCHVVPSWQLIDKVLL
jgi:hypothetical protein